MTTPGVSHPSTTTVEDFHRVLDKRAVQPVFQPLIDPDNRPGGRLHRAIRRALVIRAAEPLLRRLVPER